MLTDRDNTLFLQPWQCEAYAVDAGDFFFAGCEVEEVEGERGLEGGSTAFNMARDG